MKNCRLAVKRGNCLWKLYNIQSSNWLSADPKMCWRLAEKWEKSNTWFSGPRVHFSISPVHFFKMDHLGVAILKCNYLRLQIDTLQDMGKVHFEWFPPSLTIPSSRSKGKVLQEIHATKVHSHQFAAFHMFSRADYWNYPYWVEKSVLTLIQLWKNTP